MRDRAAFSSQEKECNLSAAETRMRTKARLGRVLMHQPLHVAKFPKKGEEDSEAGEIEHNRWPGSEPGLESDDQTSRAPTSARPPPRRPLPHRRHPARPGRAGAPAPIYRDDEEDGRPPGPGLIACGEAVFARTGPHREHPLRLAAHLVIGRDPSRKGMIDADRVPVDEGSRPRAGEPC